MKKQRFCTKGKRLLVLLFLISVSLFIVLGCHDPSGSIGPYSLDDEELLPFAAMYEIDRESLCLTEMDRDSKVEIERDYRRSYGYDVMLHIHNDSVHRTVAFVWEDNRYVWIGEQELHYSGRTLMTPDGEIPEYISVTYHEREYGAGSEITGLIIHYNGVDESIPAILTCEQAAPYLKEWDARREAPGSK